MPPAGEDWYNTYNEVWKYYSSSDSDFANLVAAFNVIGQYANFDLSEEADAGGSHRGWGSQ